MEGQLYSPSLGCWEGECTALSVPAGPEGGGRRSGQHGRLGTGGGEAGWPSKSRGDLGGFMCELCSSTEGLQRKVRLGGYSSDADVGSSSSSSAGARAGGLLGSGSGSVGDHLGAATPAARLAAVLRITYVYNHVQASFRRLTAGGKSIESSLPPTQERECE
mmetsp:Transcript_79362/g.164763  ORF Transcript_79362/g.164763 Transcript_79362/m.164763 type:complete len:162 (+) Transcript_79362:127-612(+)